MRIRILFLCLIILSQIFLSGCWDYTEYEDMAQVIGLGFDYNKESDEITITVHYISTTRSGQGEAGSQKSKNRSDVLGIIHSATDKTVFGALSKLQEVVFKEMFFGYVKIIAVGEDAAKYKMLDIIEYLNRTPAMRSTASIVISPGKAGDLLSTVDSSYTISSSQQISNLLDLSKYTGVAFPVSIEDFTEMLSIGGLEATAPRIITVSQKPEEPKAEGGIYDNLVLDENRDGDQILSGTAAFKEDRFVGWLDDKESTGFGWIRGKRITNYKTSRTSKISDNSKMEEILYFRVKKSKTEMKVNFTDNSPSISINVKVLADLRKYYSDKGPKVFDSEEVSNMEKKLSDNIRSDIDAALAKGQKELKTDIFGFGFALFRKNPKLWRSEYEKKWDEIFPDIPVNVNIEAKVINTGTNIRKLEVR